MGAGKRSGPPPEDNEFSAGECPGSPGDAGISSGAVALPAPHPHPEMPGSQQLNLVEVGLELKVGLALEGFLWAVHLGLGLLAEPADALMLPLTVQSLPQSPHV